ncbi:MULTISPECIES: hypothetical protein [unclassified Halomonas]|uniref:hypothetical protein n=1 Tax=unclassified Halomonas TaxID=2609666 RepID=UPI00048904EC|nr:MULTISPECIES: hypothetical protein [unclassified Halomonas]PKH61593.1 hypothetical protein CXF94_10425 [Halomonas sp. Choline-3u-9]QGQ72406.1 hypothetical protein FDY98_24920 [Halomonas sp. PA16-9]
MAARKQRSLKIKTLNSVCASALIGALLYIVIMGFEVVALGAMGVALTGVSTPVIVNSEGLLEVLLEIVMSIAEGIMTIVEVVVGAISGLFSL